MLQNRYTEIFLLTKGDRPLEGLTDIVGLDE